MSEMHISDGENLIKNPNEEWGAVLKFLGLKRIEFNYEKKYQKKAFLNSFMLRVSFGLFLNETERVYSCPKIYLIGTQRLEFS